MFSKKSKSLLIALLLVLLVYACGTGRKVTYLNRNAVSASLTLADDSDEYPDLGFGVTKRDTIAFEDFEGRRVMVMNAVRDEETGEMVATDVLQAAIVTARFRNVAEREGKVNLSFNVTVPKSMQDSKWQLRFYPDMFIMGDSIRLEPVIITGTGYRKAQLKGYQQYERFLASIVSDSTKFVNLGQLELFLKRNIPQIYAFRTDSTEVSDEVFYSYYGVSEKQAVEHYTNKFLKRRNERRKSRIGQMYRKYVKAPIVSEGIRLDTVMVSSDGDFVYNYVQTINARPKLRKVDIVLSGEIYEQDKKVYDVPRTEPLTFYISSISSFADNKERYLTTVVERRLSADTECRIDFEVGKADIRQELGNNAMEINRIKVILESLANDAVFDLDSIVVSATASPEGSYASNRTLSQKRSRSVSKYFDDYVDYLQDSIRYEEAVQYNLDPEYTVVKKKRPRIRFMPRSIPENWDDLRDYVLADTVLTDSQKETFMDGFRTENPDTREQMLQRESFYKYLRDTYYPRLRTVKFVFHLHRKGLVKDTVHTTVLDSAYMYGVEALKNMEYDVALIRLRPYEDYNTAVAYVGLNRNASALSILSKLEKTAEVNYLLAIVYARQGNTHKAVECYVKACQQNRMLVHRGNLDPEISTLIQTYQLNKLNADGETDISF